MGERKVKIPYPTATSGLVDGTEVSIRESTERWTEITLDDGTVIRLKPSVMSAVRIDGQFDPDGNPMYALRAGQIMLVESPPALMPNPQTEAKVQ